MPEFWLPCRKSARWISMSVIPVCNFNIMLCYMKWARGRCLELNLFTASLVVSVLS